MSDERAPQERPDEPAETGPEEVGADTERFRAFVRDGEKMDGGAQPNNAFRVLTLVIGLVVLAGLIWLLLR